MAFLITKLPYDNTDYHDTQQALYHVKDNDTGREFILDFVTGEIISAIID